MKISLLLQTGSQKTRDKKRLNQKMPTDPRTESRIGYDFHDVWFCFFDNNFFQWTFFLHFLYSCFFFFHVSIPPPTGLLQVHLSICGINQTTIPRFALTKGWRLKYQTYNLFYVQVKPANIYTLYKPSTVENPQGDRRSPFSAKYRNVPTSISISKREASCPLRKTEVSWRRLTVDWSSVDR